MNVKWAKGKTKNYLDSSRPIKLEVIRIRLNLLQASDVILKFIISKFSDGNVSDNNF